MAFTTTATDWTLYTTPLEGLPATALCAVSFIR